MKKTPFKLYTHVYIHIFVVILLMQFSLFCSKQAPTVQPNPETTTSVVGTIGVDVPQVYAVFPGRLTSHTGSPGTMTGIPPGDYDPDLTIVFTRAMDVSSVNTAIEIVEGSTTLSNLSDYSITTADNQIFNIDLTSGRVASTTYTIRIHNTAYLNGDPTKTLNFDNLEALYSGTLTTIGYVEFQFITTSGVNPPDTTPPTVLSTNPSNGATGVDIDLLPLQYILIQFSEPVNPTTVTGASILLEDSLLNPVSGSVGIVDGTNTQFFFMPSSSLNYGETYTLTISPSGNEIKDYAGNNTNPSPTTIHFTTIDYASLPAPTLINYFVEYNYNTDPAQFTVYWATDRKSIQHIEIDDAETFTTALATKHDTLIYQNYHSYTFTGLAPNQVYSIRICVDSDNSTPAGGPFDNTYTYNAVIRTIPNETEGTTGNYKLSTALGTPSDIHTVQIDTSTSYVVWNENGTDIKAQFLDSSSGDPNTWDKWTQDGVNIFSNGNVGTINTLLNGTHLIVSRNTSGNIYACSMYNSGVIGWDWGDDGSGNPDTGIQVYNGAASEARMGFVYSGYVIQITDGTHTADMEYVYDSTANKFSSVANNDIIMNDDDELPLATVSNKVDDNFLELDLPIITAGNLHYRIGNNALYASGTINPVYSTTEFGDSTYLEIGDILINISQSGNPNAYIANRQNIAVPPPTYLYTVNRDYVNLNTTDNYEVHQLKVNGTASTNILYDPNVVFSTLGGGISVNDIVVNLSTGESDIVSSIYTGNKALVLNDTSQFIFNVDNTNYQIFRLPSATNFITSGKPTSIGGNTITQTGRNFSTDGVTAGDSIYNIVTQQYTTITNVATDTLTLHTQIFSATTEIFIIFRNIGYKGILFTWTESDNIYAKVIDASNGNRLFPDDTDTSYYIITDNSNNARNPYVISDSTGNAIIIYELDAGGGNWDISAKKVNGICNFLWADPANDAIDPGIQLVTYQTPSGTRLIKKVLPDGSDGAWVLYETNAPSIGLSHINTNGTVNTFIPINNAGFADMATISATQIMLVYEYYEAGNPARIFARIYNNTPSLVSGPVQVSVGVVSKSQFYPTITPDGSGGAIIDWLDTRYFPNIYYTIYAQHLDSTLTKLYTSDKFVAIPVKDTQSSNPYEITHKILRWDDGGAPNEGIHLWIDERSSTGGEVDIYFQNISN